MSRLTEQERLAVIEFVTRLKHLFPLELHTVVLYGSKARGDAMPDSDIDLLVILDTRSRQNRVQVNKVASRVSLDFDVLLLPHVVDLAQWQEMAEGPYPFFNELFKDGLPVYGEPSLFAPLVHHDADPLAPMMATA